MNSKSRPLRVLVVVGVGLLVASTTGAYFALHPAAVAAPAAPPVGTAPPAPVGVVCYGIVDVEPGLTSIYSLQPGRVVEVVAHEHQTFTKEQVEKGEAVLFRLDARLAAQRVAEARADLTASEAQLKQALRLPEQQKAKVAQQQAAVDAAASRASAARHVLERKKTLEQIKQANVEEVAAAADLVREAEAGERAERAKLQELNLLDPAVQVTRAEQEVAAKTARLAQAQTALDEHVVKAPTAGTVLQIGVSVGAAVGGQQAPAAIFCPAGPRIVRAEVEQEFADRIHKGLKVTVHDERGNSTTWTGTVTQVADWYTQKRSQGPDPFHQLSNEVRTLEFLITLDSTPNLPRLGQRMRVLTSPPSGDAS